MIIDRCLGPFMPLKHVSFPKKWVCTFGLRLFLLENGIVVIIWTESWLSFSSARKKKWRDYDSSEIPGYFLGL